MGDPLDDTRAELGTAMDVLRIRPRFEGRYFQCRVHNAPSSTDVEFADRHADVRLRLIAAGERVVEAWWFANIRTERGKLLGTVHGYADTEQLADGIDAHYLTTFD